jgi:enolase-phosphatase E1
MRGILLDIEGTTTSISFVYDVLFPFARKHLNTYVPTTDLTNLKQEYDEDLRRGLEPPAWEGGAVRYVEWLMDQDRKSTALKKLQGEIWRAGYENGALHGEVFPDVPPALERWHRQNIDVRIFSSGSILAQRMIFSTTKAGDLTRFINGYFDTTTGPKTEASSYQQIANEFNLAAGDVVFVSDVTRELDAARSAGMKTLLCVRAGNHRQPAHTHTIIATFDGLN